MSESFRHATVESLAGPWKGSIKIGPFGSQLKREDMVAHGHKVYGQENVIANDWSAGDRRVSSAKFNALRSCELHPGDVVLSMMGTVGKCAVFPPGAEPGLMDSHLLRIQPNPELVTREFLATVLQAENVVGRQVSSMSHGSIMAGLSSSIVRRFTVPLPPLNEQPMLSVILDTLDTNIRQTEAITEKLKQVKQGLLHDLLTRGIDANGELRPPQSQAPQLYKDSPLGWIPREWEAMQLRDVGESITGSTPPSADPLAWGAGWPFITPVDVLDDHPVDSAERSVSRRGAAYIRLLPPKATLVVCIGSTIGKVGITSVEACTNQQINALVPSKTMAPEFVHLAVHRNVEQLRAMAGLQAVPIVNKTSFGSMLIPVAPLGEQTEIAVRMDAISARIRREDAAADKMRALKSGLMDDLLTGRVRVTPLLA